MQCFLECVLKQHSYVHAFFFFFASAWQTILALHLSTTFSTSCAEKLASFSGLPRFCSDVIHVIGVPRPSPFFATLPLPCIVLNANKTGEIRE